MTFRLSCHGGANVQDLLQRCRAGAPQTVSATVAFAMLARRVTRSGVSIRNISIDPLCLQSAFFGTHAANDVRQCENSRDTFFYNAGSAIADSSGGWWLGLSAFGSGAGGGFNADTDLSPGALGVEFRDSGQRVYGDHLEYHPRLQSEAVD
jgi:hypothetical protein